MKTQKELVKEYLLRGKAVNQRKAIVYWNIIRLGAIIYRLKNEGMNIKSISLPNAHNNGWYKEYFIEKQ